MSTNFQLNSQRYVNYEEYRKKFDSIVGLQSSSNIGLNNISDGKLLVSFNASTSSAESMNKSIDARPYIRVPDRFSIDPSDWRFTTNM